MIFRLILLGLILPLSLLQAQQDEHYSLFPFNQHALNPGYSGLEADLSLTGLYRNQWLGLEGSPEHQVLSGHFGLPLINSGAGFHVVNDQQGAERTTTISLTYSYHLNLFGGQLGLGLSAGMSQKALDGEKLRAPQGDYDNGSIDHNDGLLPIGLSAAWAPDAGIGVFFKNQKLEIGLSSLHIVSGKYNLSGGSLSAQIKSIPSALLYAGYTFELGDQWKLDPHLILRSDFIEQQSNIALRLTYNDNIWLGASFRGYSPKTADALVAMAGIRLSERFRVAYAYDITLNDLKRVSRGSHEVLLNYRMPLFREKPSRIINNLRFLSR